jgi:23S rRNA pseudouridine1911/1915/1917 synthase
MSAPIRFTVTAAEAGRADKVVAGRYPDLGRRQLARLFAGGAVRVAGRALKKGAAVAAGTEIELAAAPVRDDTAAPVPQPELALEVLHTDDALVAVAKPAGMPAHPLRAGERGTLANALVARFPECASAAAEAREGGLAHRLDTDTSGIILGARSREVWTALRQAFGAGAVAKDYLAVVSGDPADYGRRDGPLAQRGDHVVVTYDDDGLGATTTWEVVERGDDWALVRCRASSGRMHQIRAHLADAGTPILGDTLYGGPPGPPALVGHFLHAERLILDHPGGGQRLELGAPLPADRQACLEALRSGKR